MKPKNPQTFHRYHIDTRQAPNIQFHPQRFLVKVNRWKLAKLLVKEMVHYRGNKEVILSRPCIYGVFSGPVGGFAPRDELCVGCLRCTTQYPEMVEVRHNPMRYMLGDPFFSPEMVDTVTHEAESGRLPIRGAGYRGRFGGEGWDGMWTDMSEIVRPTRDGIHGRESISTAVDIGEKLPFIKWDKKGEPTGHIPRTLSIPLPLLWDVPPVSLNGHQILNQIMEQSAHEIHSVAILPYETIMNHSLAGDWIIPLFQSFPGSFPFEPALYEISEWDQALANALKARFPHALPIVRADSETDLLACYDQGVRIFHLTANYHGRGKKGEFIADLIQKAHQKFVQAGYRDQVTLIGSGGIVAAEHIPKAIIMGLDVIALDTPLLVALQARFSQNSLDRMASDFQLPENITLAWGKQRLKNLAGAWRDQLLEILGAMGLREVRRLRGEVGRVMFQHDLEKEAFEGIAGYHG